jgi:diguanylate cyclase (GGDEF)-like protein/PAS domain S-box-containing protein
MVAKSCSKRRASADAYRIVFEASPDYITITRLPEGQYIDVNPGFEKLMGYTLDEIVGRTSIELGIWRRPEDRKAYLELVKSGSHRPFCCELIAKDGRRIPVEATGSISVIDNEEVLIAVIRDVSERLELQLAHAQTLERERQSRHEAEHDRLTGLSNRVTLEDRLGQGIRVARECEQQYAVLFIDLDKFKPINDTYGHQVGDAVLCEVAKRLRSATRASDTVARLGGDEFVIGLANVCDDGVPGLVARKVQQSLSRPIEIDGLSCEIGASIGISRFPHDGQTPEALIRAADMAMYRAKQSGRGAVEFGDGASA